MSEPGSIVIVAKLLVRRAELAAFPRRETPVVATELLVGADGPIYGPSNEEDAP